jgi:pimeloyl-ACP methyl ester carboxylesterase
VRVDEHTITIDQSPVCYRSASASDPPPLYLHGAPTSSEDWTVFLERTGGIAPDLIGFGRSGKGGHLDYSPAGLADFLERFLAELGIERVKLVGHDWGAAAGLLLAARDPDRVERMVLIDAVPLLDGYEWHRLARVLRRPVIGELLVGSTTRSLLARALRNGSVRRDAWPDSRIATVWEQFDQGTQRALLRLHRSSDERRLAELGADLASLEMPALVLWGERDPWYGPELADAYGSRLPDATVQRVPDAGHWPWLDRPEVIELVADFLAKAVP